MDTPAHLRGRYAIVAWDPADRLLIAFRDHLGHVPLFYRQHGENLFLATDPRLILRELSVEPRLCEEAMAEQLCGVPAASTRCMFQGVAQLPAGHLLTFTNGRPRIIRYWKPRLGGAPRLADYREYYEAFEAIFRRAVERCLHGSERTATLLSGGLDSSSVTAMAAHLRPDCPFRTYTMVPHPEAALPAPQDIPNRVDFKVYDERPFVAALTARYKTLEPGFVSCPFGYPLENADRIAAAIARPPSALPAFEWIDLALAAAASDGCDLVLTGQLGDTFVSWWGRGQIRWLLSQGDFRRAFHEMTAVGLRAALGQLIEPFRPHFLSALLRGDEHPLKPWLDMGLVQPEFARRTHIAERYRAAGFGPLNSPYWHPRRWSVRDLDNGDWGNGYTDWYLHGRQYQIRIEDPTADSEVVEFCLSLPDDAYVSESGGRALVREGLRRYLPDDIRLRQTKGRQCADTIARVARHRAALAQELADYAADDYLVSMLDIERAQRVLSEVAADPQLHANWPAGMLLHTMAAARFIRSLAT